jgi:hypothetical protein
MHYLLSLLSLTDQPCLALRTLFPLPDIYSPPAPLSPPDNVHALSTLSAQPASKLRPELP